MMNSKKEVKMNKKGQAAMEFLMTYGWAILAAIIVIGIVAYYLNTSVGSSGTSSLNAPFYLVAAQVSGANDAVTFDARNGQGDTLTVSNISIDYGAAGPCFNSTSVTHGNGNTVRYSVGSCTSTPGDRFRGTVKITYTKQGSTLPQTATGSIIETAQ